MNWEVSSMPLKTSFFNPTLFKKNLSRSWPLWGGVSAVGALLPLYLMVALMSHTQIFFEQEDFVEFLYGAVAYFLPIFTACYAIFVAMFVWNYLNNSRSVGMMHSLAIDRTGLFVTNTLSGLAMLLIPYVIVGGLLCMIAALHGAMDIGAVLTTIAAVILENLLFFGMGTLCAAVSGSVVAVAVYYLVLNFAVPLVDALVNLLAVEFIFGLTEHSSDWALLFSPIFCLYDNVQSVYPMVGEVRADFPVIENFWVIVAYGVVGVALLALSWFLYRKRRSESAGDVVAFSWLRPVFRFGIAFVSALTLGRVLYELFWASLFRNGLYADMIPMAVCMMISAVVGYYAASMLLEKSLRVFKGSLRGVGIICAAIAVLCIGIEIDIFGLERNIPDAEKVKSVSISGYLDINCNAEKFPGLCEDIVELHEAIVADRDYIRTCEEDWYTPDEQFSWRSISLVYTLKNGSRLERHYYFPLSEERVKDTNTYDGKCLALTRNPDVLIASVTVPENSEIVNCFLESYDAEGDFYATESLNDGDWQRVYEALQRDAVEGNFVANAYFWEEVVKFEPEVFARTAYLYVEYRIIEENGNNRYGHYGNIAVQLQPSMKHTLNALVAVGALDTETINSWYTIE